jgi:hypothetical protein
MAGPAVRGRCQFSQVTPAKPGAYLMSASKARVAEAPKEKKSLSFSLRERVAIAKRLRYGRMRESPSMLPRALPHPSLRATFSRREKEQLCIFCRRQAGRFGRVQQPIHPRGSNFTAQARPAAHLA